PVERDVAGDRAVARVRARLEDLRQRDVQLQDGLVDASVVGGAAQAQGGEALDLPYEELLVLTRAVDLLWLLLFAGAAGRKVPGEAALVELHAEWRDRDVGDRERAAGLVGSRPGEHEPRGPGQRERHAVDLHVAVGLPLRRVRRADVGEAVAGRLDQP